MKILNNQKGFTLIELVLIIIILGVLAAVAIPKFVSLQSDATAANNIAYVGALRSAISIRFAEQSLRGVGVGPDVIGSTALEAPATNTDIQGLVTTPSVLPSSLSPTAGACGVGKWTGLQPGVGGAAPVSGDWTLTCGATLTDPISIAGP